MTDDTHDGIVSDAAAQYKRDAGKLPFEEGKLYTYADLCKWREDHDNGPGCMTVQDRYELFDGVPAVMASPSQMHQEIVVELVTQLHIYLKGKTCKVFVAPFDVRLNAGTADNTVLQPDVLVVCDHSKLDGKSCAGAPDMAIEVISPGSAQADRFRKLRQYEKHGVREYWIADPECGIIHAHELSDGHYFIKAYSFSDSVPVGVLPGCVLSLADYTE